MSTGWDYLIEQYEEQAANKGTIADNVPDDGPRAWGNRGLPPAEAESIEPDDLDDDGPQDPPDDLDGEQEPEEPAGQESVQPAPAVIEFRAPENGVRTGLISCASKDCTRPAIQNILLAPSRTDPKAGNLIATNGHMLAIAPVHSLEENSTVGDENRIVPIEVLAEAKIPKGESRPLPIVFDPTDGQAGAWKVNTWTKQSRFSGTDSNYPDVTQVMPKEIPDDAIGICFNVNYLRCLADALGCSPVTHCITMYVQPQARDEAGHPVGKWSPYFVIGESGAGLLMPLNGLVSKDAWKDRMGSVQNAFHPELMEKPTKEPPIAENGENV